MIYVVDGFNQRVQRWIPNASSGSTVAGQAAGTAGSGLSYLNYPTDVVLDSSGNMYVLDGGNSRVVYWAVAASAGVLVAGAGKKSSLLLNRISKIKKLRVINLIHNAWNYAQKPALGGYGSANNQLTGPLGISRDSTSGTLYIADSGNHRVMSYLSGASTGTVVAGGNGQGTGSNQLSNPRGIQYVSSSNSVYIANNGAHNIVRWVIGATSWILVAGSPSGVSGSTGAFLSFPTYVLVDSLGNVYASDEGNQRVQYFAVGQTNGSTLAGVTGVSGSSSTLLNIPSSVSVDSQFNIYAVDYGNQRVQKFVQC